MEIEDNTVPTPEAEKERQSPTHVGAGIGAGSVIKGKEIKGDRRR